MSGKKHEAESLLSEKSEKDVTTFINNLARTYDLTWHPLGDQLNNYGIVDNQASSSLGALNEIISNGIDAVLRRRYIEMHSSEYNPDHDLNSYAEAADDLLRGDEEVRVAADGGKGTTGDTNIIISDTGEGQTPETFPDTFVDLIDPGMNKKDWPFLQGQFGMGSTAVIPHCGNSGYKAIFSAGMEEPNKWTWTVTRQNRDGNQYDYLKLDGELPTFEGQLRHRDSGTFIKMFNYDLPSHTNITSNLRYKFSRTMTRVPFPVILDERRDYKSSIMEMNLVGIKQLIERKSEYMHKQKTREYDFGGELGSRTVELHVFKSDKMVEQDDELKKPDGKNNLITVSAQRNRALFFTVNGQVHGDLGLSFIKNRCDKYHIGKDLVVFVDFSDLGPAQLTDLFTPARDRLKDGQMAERLKSGMKDIITSDPMLVNEERRRREKFTKDKREEKIDDLVEELVSRNPALKDYFENGEKVETDTPSDGGDSDSSADEDQYKAPFFPDTLKIIDGRSNGTYDFWDTQEQGTYTFEMPCDSKERLHLFLNAPDNFFERDESPGTKIITPRDIVLSTSLRKGRWILTLDALKGAEPGQEIPVRIDVGASSMNALSAELKIKYTEPAGGDNKTESTDEDTSLPAEQLDFPDTRAVFEDDWNDFDQPFDSDTPIRIINSDGSRVIFINYDADPIKDFLNRHNVRKTGKETIKETWKVGCAMYGLSTLIELDDELEKENINSRRMTEVSMRGIAQSMLDQHISESELEALTV
jgi:hypothetical protein